MSNARRIKWHTPSYVLVFGFFYFRGVSACSPHVVLFFSRQTRDRLVEQHATEVRDLVPHSSLEAPEHCQLKPDLSEERQISFLAPRVKSPWNGANRKLSTRRPPPMTHSFRTSVTIALLNQRYYIFIQSFHISLAIGPYKLLYLPPDIGGWRVSQQSHPLSSRPYAPPLSCTSRDVIGLISGDNPEPIASRVASFIASSTQSRRV